MSDLALCDNSAADNFSLVEQEQRQIYGDATFGRSGMLRFELRRWWTDRPKRWAAWLMLNPSRAGKKKNDPTMCRVIDFSQSWGYDGCIVVNIYPFISSDPNDMWKWAKWQNNGPDWYTRDDLQSNLGYIEDAARRSCLRILAYGAQPALKDFNWLQECIERFSQPFDYRHSDWVFEEEPMCLGHSNAGQPLHPLARGKMRIPRHTIPRKFSQEAYA